MQTKYRIEVCKQSAATAIEMECTNRQAQKVFNALAYALTGGLYTELGLYAIGRVDTICINRAYFKGVRHA